MLSALHPISRSSSSVSAASSRQSGKDERISISLSKVHKAIQDLLPELQDQVIPRDALFLDILETPYASPTERIQSAWRNATGNQGNHSQEETSASRTGLLKKALTGWRNPPAFVEKVREQFFKMALLANHSKVGGLNYDVYLQESLRRGHQPLFIALLRGSPKPDLPPLIQRVVRDGNENAWAEIVKKVDKALPDNTMYWLAEYGEPKKLEQLLNQTPRDTYPLDNALSWILLARQQEKNIKGLETLAPMDRQNRLAQLMSRLTHRSLSLQAAERTLAEMRADNQDQSAIQTAENQIRQARREYESALAGGRLNFLPLSRTMDVPKKLKHYSLYMLCQAVASGHINLLKLLLDGRGVNMKNPDFACYVRYATEQNQNAMLELLLNEPGADVNQVSEQGAPLHIAADEGLVNLMATLLNKPGIQVNLPDEEGFTPLHVATLKNQAGAAVVLLDAPGMDVNARDLKGRTALHLAVINGHADVLEKLLSAKGIDISARDKKGRTLMHYAASGAHVGVLQTLLDIPGINLNMQDEDGRAPLHVAAANTHRDVLEKLLNAEGLDISIRDKGGRTPLHYAAKAGCLHAIITLSNTPGMDINARDKDERTPLHYAVNSGCLTAVSSLANVPGINIHVRDKKGKTPLQYASDPEIRAVLAELPTFNHSV